MSLYGLDIYNEQSDKGPASWSSVNCWGELHYTLNSKQCPQGGHRSGGNSNLARLKSQIINNKAHSMIYKYAYAYRQTLTAYLVLS